MRVVQDHVRFNIWSLEQFDWQAWRLALLATAPMVAVYLFHFTFVPSGMSPTGFLQYDAPYYMANARAHFVDGFSLTYGLPFSAEPNTPKIYFQPLTFVWGLTQRISGWDPGYIFAGTGVLAGIVMFRTAIALARTFSVPARGAAGTLTYLSFLWGGGVVVLVGLLLFLLGPPSESGAWIWSDAFVLDPFDGFWFLNLGRNVYYATEAVYHALFFISVILVIRRKYHLAAATIAVMSASHPFTGLELILIVGAFATCEFLIDRSTAPPVWFIALLATLLFLHLGYYLFLLKLLSPEHRVLEEQWSLPWVLTLPTILVAYGPVMILAAVRLMRRQQWRTELALPEVRFLLVWFIVAFALANHDLLIPPRQPLHFTRGYDWTPLALLALPVVEGGFKFAMRYSFKPLRFIAIASLLTIALLDNAAWFGRQYYLTVTQHERNAWLLSDDAKATLTRLSQSDMQGRLLLSNDYRLAYMAIVYAGLRTWFAHGYITPNASLRESELEAFFANGIEAETWQHRPLIVVVDTAALPGRVDELASSSGLTLRESVGRYQLFVRDPN